MKNLEKGQTIMIYGKPLTSELPEGQAKLIKPLEDVRNSEVLQNWKVKFLSDEFVTERLVNIGGK